MDSSVNEVICTNCGAPYLFEKKRWRDTIKCTKCNAELTLDSTSSTANTEPVDAPVIQSGNPAQDFAFPPQSSDNVSSNLPPTAGGSAPTSAMLPPGSSPPNAASQTSARTTAAMPPTASPQNVGTPPSLDAAPVAIRSGTTTQAAYQLKSGGAATLSISALILLLVVGGLGAAYIAVGDKLWQRPKTEDVVVKQQKGIPSVDEKKSWPSADKNAAKFGKIRVKIKQVIFAPVRGKDGSNVVQTSGETSYLHIHLEIRNMGPEGSPYLSWYGNLFEDGMYRAEVYDQDDREFDMMVFEDITAIAGHTASRSMGHKDIFGDVIIFEIPADTSLSDIKELYCRLPGQAFSVNGSMKFKIPASMIKDGSNVGPAFGPDSDDEDEAGDNDN